MKTNKKPVIIIDGKNLLWRNSDAFSELTACIGGSDVHTGGMYGFIAALLRIKQKYRGKIIIAWEGKNNFRYDLYKDYKRREEKTLAQTELYHEVEDNEGRLQELLSFAGVPQYYGIGCEGDDVMGSLASYVTKKKKYDCFIYSGDSDVRQLVTNKIRIIASLNRNELIYDRARVKQKHGVYPKHIPLLKALSGDSSDNIPGLNGIGEKTAAKLINQYKTFKNIFNAALVNQDDWPVADRFKDIILEEDSDVELFLKLTTIKIDYKMLRHILIDKDKKQIVDLLNKYKFRSLSSAAELIGIMSLYK